MQSFEKLGLFYLGKKVNQDNDMENYFLYESKDLTTHAFCVGMTGSGKTGLCISLLEEAAIDNIPSIIIDPKGDIGNLLLTFPNLSNKDFLPWINLDEANRQNLSAEEFAERQAEIWRKGLAEWEQDGSRIELIRNNVDMTIYTPGSSAGISISILNSFAAPLGKIIEDSDLFNDCIQTITSGLLELLGIKADPIQSREHILISNIISHFWRSGEDLDLAKLIQAIQSPPINQIGVFQIDSFYSANDRLKLAMSFNNLLAAPAFKNWLEGDALDVNQMLYTESGKPRIAIFSIAHLSDAERMFFVTILLNQVLGWMRSQPGTTSLRALLYMDEVFGYLPPIGEPPSKKPILTLLKQARAFGLGVTLATQNPVDIDYKALSNTGTWFIGRLQTQNDINRLIDGLTSVSSIADNQRKDLFKIISSLNKREFLVKNVHEDQSILIKTRWALSYLRGPLTRDQIKQLMQEKKTHSIKSFQETELASLPNDYSNTMPELNLSPYIRQYYAPINNITNANVQVVYIPYLIAGAEIQIFHNTYGISKTQQIAHRIKLSDDMTDISWDQAREFQINTEILSGNKFKKAIFKLLPASIQSISHYNQMDKQYETFLYRNYQLSLLKSDRFNVVSNPDETERDFRIRLDLLAREKRDLEIDRLKRKYATKTRSLETQLLTAQQQIERESDQYKQKQMDIAVTVGSTILGALLGGGRTRTGITRTARSASKIAKEKQDIERAKTKMLKIQSQIDKLNINFEDDARKLSEQYDTMNEPLKQIIIRPKKTDINQKYYGILWIPFSQNERGNMFVLNSQIVLD